MATALNTILALATKTCGRKSKEITAETRFAEDLNFDSLDYLDFSMKVERKTGVRIPNKELSEFRTIGEMADWIENVGPRKI